MNGPLFFVRVGGLFKRVPIEGPETPCDKHLVKKYIYGVLKKGEFGLWYEWQMP